MNKKVAVYCASSEKISMDFLNSAYNLGKLLAENGHKIIYGGGNLGSMGRLADGALSVDGEVIGVIPSFLMELELGHGGLTELIIVNSMHERQSKMLSLSDTIIALPGGIGTILELVEAMTFKKHGLINSPIIIVNENNYYNDMLNMIEKSIKTGFVTVSARLMWKVAKNIEEAVELVENFEPYNIPLLA